MNDRKKAELCAKWLQTCLRIGWKKSDLDALEKIWWKFEGWKYQA